MPERPISISISTQRRRIASWRRIDPALRGRLRVGGCVRLTARSESPLRRAGCGNSARPDLWGARVSNPLAYPTTLDREGRRRPARLSESGAAPAAPDRSHIRPHRTGSGASMCSPAKRLIPRPCFSGGEDGGGLHTAPGRGGGLEGPPLHKSRPSASRSARTAPAGRASGRWTFPSSPPCSAPAGQGATRVHQPELCGSLTVAMKVSPRTNTGIQVPGTTFRTSGLRTVSTVLEGIPRCPQGDPRPGTVGPVRNVEPGTLTGKDGGDDGRVSPRLARPLPRQSGVRRGFFAQAPGPASGSPRSG